MPEQPKGGINIYINLQKHKLDHIAARNVIISLNSRIAFLKLSYGVSKEERTKTNMVSVISIIVLANSFNHSQARHHNIKCKKATCSR